MRVAEVFFADKVESEGIAADVVHFIQARQAPVGAHKFRTLLVDIADPNAVMRGMRKQTRYEIRRAERQDRLDCQMSVRPSPQELDSFVCAFAAFAKSKGISPANVGRLRALRSTQNLALSQVEANGTVIARHAYIIHEGRARLLHSCGGAVDDDYPTFNRAAVGRANRYLHWFDMCSFSSSSFGLYDLGGISPGNDPDLAGIDEFKAGFGGVPRLEYNMTRSGTARGALAIFLSNRARDGR